MLYDIGVVHTKEPFQKLVNQGMIRCPSYRAAENAPYLANDEVEMPLGLGEVDFKLVAEYMPPDALKVVELNPRHGRAELLASIQFMLDHGF